MSPLKVWPVIHVDIKHPELAIENAKIAAENNCEGVFLIQMEGQDIYLVPVYMELRQRFPTLKLGFNFLSLNQVDALYKSLTLGADATWTDKSGLHELSISPEAQRVSEILVQHPQHLFFGSVAFKYQAQDRFPETSARNAVALGMIPTTSGEATGSAPSVKKLEDLQKENRIPLALASGVAPSNIQAFAPHLDYVLVSTGISKDFYRFDEDLLNQLMKNLSIR